MEKENLVGQMDNVLKETMLKTKNKGLVSLDGQMEGLTVEIGKMVGCMEKVYTLSVELM